MEGTGRSNSGREVTLDEVRPSPDVPDVGLPSESFLAGEKRKKIGFHNQQFIPLRKAFT